MSGTDFERVVQWYPGHMVTAMRRIDEYLKLIDVVIEVVDARVPRSGSNPMLDAIAAHRERLLVLTFEDVADPGTTARWLRSIGKRRRVVAVDARDQSRVARVSGEIAQLMKSVTGTKRAMVVGLPNSGKSAIINGLLGRSAAKTEDRAGVTRSLQWFRVHPKLELMDTPGILVPKIVTNEAQWKLALVGAVPRERYDPEDIAARFHAWLRTSAAAPAPVPDLEAFARARGFMRRGGQVDYHNAAQSYIKDFNEGKFGRISLEKPPDDDNQAA
ncbi:MAG: ribosome biogenesis GTPase YlqF [Candidatus Eremiobacteraeota bacterium]|nr:ribosome biogenesis GTPase YlqF [Candidatus Eremiobacteraeota bacterium]